jgi:putative tryptophan/tyrosine transport system substrate-binding protein
MDVRLSGVDIDRIRALAHELVGLQSDIILAGTRQARVALERETQTIPIVYASVIDSVTSGLVARRLDRPGGNIAGFATTEGSLGGKWLELLSEIVPGLKRAAIMSHPKLGDPYSGYIQAAARSLKIELVYALVVGDAEIETATVAAGREPRSDLVVIPDAFTFAHRAPIISAAARNNVPAVSWLSDFARNGGLLSYGVDVVGTFRGAATYVDRILRGAKPEELPIHYPTKFEMAVNLKTARALGLTVPQSILLRADEVIE